MNKIVEVIINLEIGSLIIACLFITTLIILWIQSIIKKPRDVKIDGASIGLGTISFHICNDKTDRQIAYKILVEMKTRVVSVDIDYNEDIIKSVNDSYYSFFQITRDLLKEMPIDKLPVSSDFVKMVMMFLNSVMRPYLTKWGLKFKNWYENEERKEENKGISPQELQKKYEHYDELINDLTILKNNVDGFAIELESFIFRKKKKCD